MFERYYELSCDHCGGGEQISANRKEAERQARDYGWIFTRVKGEVRHFDTERCRDSFDA